MLLQRQNPYALSNTYIRTTSAISFAGLEEAGGNTLYPPSTHILFIPFFAFLASPEAGTIAWMLWNIVFIGVIFYGISRKYLANNPFVHKYLFFILMVGAYATKSCFRYGQTSLFCFAFFVATLLIKDKHKIAGGVLFAFALAKPSLMILFAWYFIARREYTIVFTGIAIHIALTIAAANWLGISPLALMSDYAEKVSLLTSQKTSLWLYYQVNGVSLKSILNILGTPSAIVFSITTLLYCAAAVIIYAKRKHSELYVLGLTALLTIFIDYHWHYDFVVLFLLFPIFAQDLKNNPTRPVSLLYFLLVLYMPDLLRAGATGVLLASNNGYLLIWQLCYTLLFAVLAILFLQKAPNRNEPKKRSCSQ